MKPNKHERRNSKLELPKEDSKIAVSKWEDLLQMKDKVTEDIKVQLAALGNMIKTANVKLEANPELKNEIRDVCKAYNDISNDLRITMEKHIQFEGNEVKDYRKGEIYDTDKDNDEVFDYLQIAGEYINESGRVRGLMEHTYISIFPKLGVYDKDIEKFKEIEEKVLKGENNDNESIEQ